MTQATIVLLFLFGFVGIMLWIIGVIALDILRDSQRTRENRQETDASERYVAYGPHDAHHVSQQL